MDTFKLFLFSLNFLTFSMVFTTVVNSYTQIQTYKHDNINYERKKKELEYINILRMCFAGGSNSVINQLIKFDLDVNKLYKYKIYSQYVNHSFDIFGRENLYINEYSEYTLLQIACLKKNEDLIKCLLEYKDIDVNITDEQGRTVLYYCNDINVLKLILEHGKININSKDYFGNTAFMDYMKMFKEDLAKELIKQKDINIFIKNNKGKNVIDFKWHRYDYGLFIKDHIVQKLEFLKFNDDILLNIIDYM